MKKQKLLVISKEYWPTSNATVTCLSNILNGLKDNFEITIVTTSLNNKTILEKVDEMNFIRIGSILGRDLTTKNLAIRRIASGIKYFFSPNSDRNWPNIYSFIKRRIDLSQYSYILSISMPYINVAAAHNISLKINGLKHIIIPLDLYADNPSLLCDDKENNTYLDRVREEKIWFSQAYKIFTTKEFKNSFLKDHGSIKDKFVVISHPLVYKISEVEFHFDHSNINCVYTGHFYSNIRSADSIISLFENLSFKNSKFKFHIFGSGNVPEHNILSIKHYGMVSKEKAVSAIYSADILVNIGNNSQTQIPSKIFEYISTGKPIINIYSVDYDLCNSILQNYELAYIISENELSNMKNIDDLYNWIIKVQGRKIEFNKIKYKYIENTPEYVSKRILEEI